MSNKTLDFITELFVSREVTPAEEVVLLNRLKAKSFKRICEETQLFSVKGAKRLEITGLDKLLDIE